ncbi:hypothetical protein SUGI_0368300 [Cryptomeria japonica]|nr:hypothetical protein SUGI_0368300 [Cryptomeria japonica]
MAISNIYNVEVVEREIVLPALPLQEHVLPFSNIDLTIPALAVHSSLSNALVSFDAFAGRLVSNGVGETELVCNNKGVEFAKAYALTSLAQVEFCNPIAAVGDKLVPPTNYRI